jgi:hypothetical protein
MLLLLLYVLLASETHFSLSLSLLFFSLSFPASNQFFFLHFFF